MLLYGLVHNAKPVAIMSALWILVDLAVALGVILN
jgi:hypothetical protein